MGVRLGPTVLADVPMDIEIGDHAFLDQLGLHELARQLDVVFLRQLARQSELDLAGKLGILALLGGLDRVPQRSPISEGFGRASRQHHFGVKDACLVREIMGSVDPRSEEHTSELQSLMRISYAVFCLKKKKRKRY